MRKVEEIVRDLTDARKRKDQEDSWSLFFSENKTDPFQGPLIFISYDC